MTLTVSVLVTVYNREAYLQETLESILASTFDNFEILVVDDSSTDQSVCIAERVREKDPRVRIVRNESNLGDYGNRMIAAAHAQGEFLKYVDSDDLIYPHTLQVMVEAMRQNEDAALGLAHSMPEDIEPYPWRLSPVESYRKHFLGRGCFGCGPTGAIIRRDVFDAMGGFSKQWGVLSDTELWLRIAAEKSIVLLPPGLVWWRRHEGQEFSTGDANDVYLEKGHALDMKALESPHCPLEAPDLAAAIDARKHEYARKLLSLSVRQFQIRKTWKMYQSSELALSDIFSAVQRKRPAVR